VIALRFSLLTQSELRRGLAPVWWTVSLARRVRELVTKFELDRAEVADRGMATHLGDDLRRRYNPIIKRIRDMDKPVIAAVNGVAAGAGCSLALACDMRIASDQAAFIEVFINVGLIPDSGSTFTLPRLVGLGKAMELCMTGQKVDATEALRLGLVNQVVPAAELDAAARKLASRIASMPARAIALTKRLLNQSMNNDLEAQLEAEAYDQETAGKTSDHSEGVVAFIEKRKPNFQGK
jgi:2-(1,2-epoxy-1,2-dihydrophenyl)acetyl-CoA isomerase